MNLREMILAADDKRLVAVDAPEWGCTLYLRAWSGADRAKVQHLDRDSDLMAKVFILSVCDSWGERLFKDEDLADVLDKDGVAIERIALLALDHNGITKGKADEAKN